MVIQNENFELLEIYLRQGWVLLHNRTYKWHVSQPLSYLLIRYLFPCIQGCLIQNTEQNLHSCCHAFEVLYPAIYKLKPFFTKTSRRGTIECV